MSNNYIPDPNYSHREAMLNDAIKLNAVANDKTITAAKQPSTSIEKKSFFKRVLSRIGFSKKREVKVNDATSQKVITKEDITNKQVNHLYKKLTKKNSPSQKFFNTLFDLKNEQGQKDFKEFLREFATLNKDAQKAFQTNVFTQKESITPYIAEYLLEIHLFKSFGNAPHNVFENHRVQMQQYPKLMYVLSAACDYKDEEWVNTCKRFEQNNQIENIVGYFNRGNTIGNRSFNNNVSLQELKSKVILKEAKEILAKDNIDRNKVDQLVINIHNFLKAYPNNAKEAFRENFSHKERQILISKFGKVYPNTNEGQIKPPKELNQILEYLDWSTEKDLEDLAQDLDIGDYLTSSELESQTYPTETKKL